MSNESRKTLIKRREVLARTAMANSTLYELMRAGKFPQSVKIGPRSVAWVSEEVDAWLEERIAARGQGVARC
ncbi:helix-turn-helix transcriptional regulator [Halomonas alimentaria]|uniref:helix-turn-helix transcriptional regulator n=1 Tax=Halomonas alimentaria TaxID=147248 RepID=UPI00248F8096|nr:AlpA family transcriptional regulator [Halomonas alimentaria]